MADFIKAITHLKAASRRLLNAIDLADDLRRTLAQQAEPDHETRAELAEQQVVQLAEEREHYRRLWQKAQAEPVAFDPAEAMRLADEYAYAQSELDGEHSVNRLYYVKSRNEARAKLACYLGIKENGNG